MKIEHAIGVDGCKAGWFFVAIDKDRDGKFGIVECIAELWAAFKDTGSVLIDIPIGLISAAGPGRFCDAEARKILKPHRHNSVFSPPCRQALSAGSYAEACCINHAVCGSKISRQAWGISRKIKEVDIFLHDNPAAREWLRETHPEVCFWAMAGGKPMTHGKKSAAGHAERLRLLQRAYPQAHGIYEVAMDRYRRSALGRDDIVDALVNAVTATCPEKFATLPHHPPTDQYGLPMEIVYSCLPRPPRLPFA